MGAVRLTIRSMTQHKRYITTPIYYVNDRPHIGHIYTTLLCDVYARFMRLAGRDVFFLTGTDEHGVKVEKSAAAQHVGPQALADQNAAHFRQAFERFELSHDDFIRTTEDRHERQVQRFVQQLLDAGAVYLGEFEGWYDEGQEEYIAETKARELNYKSPVTGKPLIRATEENYYFRLSEFQNQLEQLFEQHPGFVRPEARRNEVLARVREGLQDVPMSRTNFKWGIAMPNDPKHVIYVWIDALLNYVTALGLGEPDSDIATKSAHYWPAEYHVIGKEILWFHAVIWPAMLMALKQPLPKCVYAHAYWTAEGQKMSKSLGNFIDLPTLNDYIDRYGLDAVRYYLTLHGPLSATDADFSAAHFHDVYTADLANTFGNCASRTTAMINKYFDGVVPSESPNGERITFEGYDWPALTSQAVHKAIEAHEALALDDAINEALMLLRKVDHFIDETAPFKRAKDESKRDEVGAILYQCVEAVRLASLLLNCVLPNRTAELWQALGLEIDPRNGELPQLAQWGAMPVGHKIPKVALFPRIEEPIEPVTA